MLLSCGQNEHSIRHASTLIKTRNATQDYNMNNNSQGVGLGATAHKNPPADPN